MGMGMRMGTGRNMKLIIPVHNLHRYIIINIIISFISNTPRIFINHIFGGGRAQWDDMKNMSTFTARLDGK